MTTPVRGTAGTTAAGADGAVSRARQRARVPADAALILIGACFVLPLLWLVLASLDASAGHEARLPRRTFLGQLCRDPDTGAAVPATVEQPGPLCRDCRRQPCGRSPCRLPALPVPVPVQQAVHVYGPVRDLPADHRHHGPGLRPVCAAWTCLDSMPATIFFMATTTLPMAIWMTKNFMDAVPVSLEEAAWVDGASGLMALRTIVLPLMRQGLGVVFIFVFIQAWGNFFVPFVLLLSEARQPAAVSIFSFFGQHGAVAYGQLAAFSILYSVPVLALYVIVAQGSRQFLRPVRCR